MVLEILPLPSNPKTIRKASEKSFTNAQNIVQLHAPRVSSFSFPFRGIYLQGGGFVETALPSSIKVTFHEKIGTHDIAVVQPKNIAEFASWIEIFLKDNNITQGAYLQNFESILKSYIVNGFDYFVLDLIELSARQKSVEPIFYEFETNSIYYPLKISSLASGETKITLFLLTREAVDQLFCFPFRFAYYGSDPSILNPPVQFTIKGWEIRSIDENSSHLFGNSAWFTALQYSGPNSALTEDFALSIWTFRLSYVTLTMYTWIREILNFVIAMLPLEILIGVWLLLAVINRRKSTVSRKDIEIYLR